MIDFLYHLHLAVVCLVLYKVKNLGPKDLASYAGLVPSLDASAGKEKRGRITKQGSRYLRPALVEAAQAAARMKNCRVSIFFRRRIVKAGYQKAIVATAHKILQYAFYVWKNQTPYRETYPVCA